MFGPNIYVYHEIVHNRYVVERFTSQGVTFVEDLSQVPDGSLLLYSAHGVSPQIRADGPMPGICRRSTRRAPWSQRYTSRRSKFAREGYHIVLIGHSGHDEVIGTMGEAPRSITLVESVEEVDFLPFPANVKIAYLTQTTLSVDEANAVIERLKQRYPQIASPPKEDICYATTNRQEAVSGLMEESDMLIVLGSQNSSNSRRLMEIGRACGKPAYLVDGLSELQPEWFHDDQTVAITAGASAPEEVVQECVDYLVEHFGASVRDVTFRRESVSFPLPRELRAKKATV